MITSQGIGTSMHSVSVGSERLRLALELVAGTVALSQRLAREKVQMSASAE